MADTSNNTTSPNKRDPHYFTVDGKHYQVQLVKANYDTLASTIGFLTTKPTGEVEEIAIGKAMREGYLFPLRISGLKGTRRKGATIYIPRDKIEDAFKATGGLVGKQYGTWVISKVAPVLKRLITA
jgi:hypothetical protein